MDPGKEEKINMKTENKKELLKHMDFIVWDEDKKNIKTVISFQDESSKEVKERYAHDLRRI